jgi:hypothetical protein
MGNNGMIDECKSCNGTGFTKLYSVSLKKWKKDGIDLVDPYSHHDTMEDAQEFSEIMKDNSNGITEQEIACDACKQE